MEVCYTWHGLLIIPKRLRLPNMIVKLLVFGEFVLIVTSSGSDCAL